MNQKVIIYVAVDIDSSKINRGQIHDLIDDAIRHTDGIAPGWVVDDVTDDYMADIIETAERKAGWDPNP